MVAEIVKDLPCSTVRAFARKLHIKIPWTKLATNPIEVVLDTVECVFAQGKQSYSSPSSTSSHNANAANGRTPNPQPGFQWNLTFYLLSEQDYQFCRSFLFGSSPSLSVS
jgi:hypothetical protein